MKAAVTGANGLLGAHVVRALLDAGHGATAVVRPRADLSGLSGVDTQVARADLRSPAALERAFEGADVVVHCAAVFSYVDADEAEIRRAAVDGTRAVVEAAAEVGVRRVVVTSSSVTCGSSVAAAPCDETGGIGTEWVPPYFRAKVAQEEAARDAADARGIELVLACPTVVVGGPDRRLVPSNAMLVRYLLDPLRTTFPGGCNVIGVRDAGQGHVLLAERGVAGERYLLGGEDLSWRALHALVSELCGIDGPHVTATATAAWIAASAAEALAHATGRPPLATKAEARTVGRFHWYSSDKARALGYAPAPARAALAAALAWLVTSPHVPRLVRDRLVLAEEVYAARELQPAPLTPAAPAR